MHNLIINHSPDLKRLRDEGFDIRILHGHIFVFDVPYVDKNKEVKFGILITVLNPTQKNIDGSIATIADKPSTHVAYFTGDLPCYSNGSPIVQLNRPCKLIIGNEVEVHWEFSMKPNNKVPENYYQLITNYEHIIVSHAKEINPEVSARNFRVVNIEEEESVFKYYDTNASRAEITKISNKLKGYKIGIIGLGGTGSYILDLVAKTEVKEIHLFDGDYFLQHNSFRAPGAVSKEELSLKLKKTTYYQTIYSKMRNGIIDHPEYFTSQSLDTLNVLDFVFLCFDKGSIKKSIVERLELLEKPFIDVGISVESVDNECLIGTMKVVSSKSDCRNFVREKNRIDFSDADEDLYNHNIQIAELNSLNACLAVIKWKKYFGFYQDKNNENFTYYSTNNQLFIDDDHSS